MKRIFIAINLPQYLKNQLEILKKEIEELFPQELINGMIKWVKKEAFHITLIFIGKIEEKEISQICNIVKQETKNQFPFFLKLKKITYGPPKKIPPRLIWVELKKNPQLKELVKKLKKRIIKIRVLKEMREKDFLAHITLGRIKTWQWKKMEIEERPQIEKEIDFQFEVNSIEVMESKLKPSGVKYFIIQSFNFK